MKKITKGALLGALAFASSGCATVINGPNLDYSMNSDPEGALLVLHDGQSCTAPCELSLPRSTSTRIDFSLVGYEPTHVLVQSKTGAATVGNVLAGGLIGAVVDSGNGSNRFLSPRPLYVKLAPVGSGEEALLLDKKGEVISTVAEHNDEVRLKVAKHIGADAAGVSSDDMAETAGEDVAGSE